MTDDQWEMLVQQTKDCFSVHDVQWLFSYVSLDRTRSICFFEASNAEPMRSHYRKMGISFDQIWRSHWLAPN